MKSRIFSTGKHREIAKSIKERLNAEPDFLSEATAASTRAAGDAIQSIIARDFAGILGPLCREYSSTFARRSMADLAFIDTDNLYHAVDVKTHRLYTSFNMPNLISVERLARFYQDDRNYFDLIIVEYRLEKRTKIEVLQVHFVPIEFLSWDCLTIGALGWGQIQIANANNITIIEGYPRKAWMLQLCEKMMDFYPKEMEKLKGRIDYFREVKAFWEGRGDE